MIGLASLICCKTINILKNGDKYPLIGLFERNEKKELLIMLADKSISPKIEKLVRDRLDSIALKQVTGIVAEKTFQEKIIDCYDSAQGRLNYNDFKKALTFLEIDKLGKLKIREISWLDRAWQFYWFVLTGATLICTYQLFFTLISVQLSFSRQIHLILIIILYVAMIYSFVHRGFILNTAIKIAKEIN